MLVIGAPYNTWSQSICRHNTGLVSWWRHQMETFSALLAICGGIHRSPVNSLHKGQWYFLWYGLNKRLSEQSWGWWFETPSLPLWRHCDVSGVFQAPRNEGSRHMPLDITQNILISIKYRHHFLYLKAVYKLRLSYNFMVDELILSLSRIKVKNSKHPLKSNEMFKSRSLMSL